MPSLHPTHPQGSKYIDSKEVQWRNAKWNRKFFIAGGDQGSQANLFGEGIPKCWFYKWEGPFLNFHPSNLRLWGHSKKGPWRWLAFKIIQRHHYLIYWDWSAWTISSFQIEVLHAFVIINTGQRICFPLTSVMKPHWSPCIFSCKSSVEVQIECRKNTVGWIIKCLGNMEMKDTLNFSWFQVLNTWNLSFTFFPSYEAYDCSCECCLKPEYSSG